MLSCKDMGVAQWPREYQELLQQVDVQTVRIIDANQNGLAIDKSTQAPKFFGCLIVGGLSHILPNLHLMQVWELFAIRKIFEQKLRTVC